MKSRFLGLAGLLVCAVIWGCGPSRPDVVPVSGVVTYQGKPVEGAQVTFMAPNTARAAFGVTDAEGKFQLTTYDTNDGAPVGVHKVSIAKPTQAAASAESMSPDSPDAGYAAAMSAAATGGTAVETTLPEKYANPETSGLTREVVKPGPNEFPIDLE